MINERLLAELKAADRDTRLDAYDEISIEMDDDLAQHIVGIAAGSDDEAIRADAVIALGPVIEELSMDEDDAPVSSATFEAVVRQLRSIYEDESQPKVVRRRAFESLVRDPQPWQRDEIRRLGSSDDETWRLTAVFGMGYVSGFEKEILQILGSGRGVLLAEAVRAAANRELEQAADQIRSLAQDDTTEHDVRVEAILALPLVDSDAAEILDEIVSDDPEIEEAVAIALDEMGDYV